MKFKDLEVGQKLVVYVAERLNVYEMMNAIVEEKTSQTISFRYLDNQGRKKNGITLVAHSKHFWDLSESLDGYFKIDQPIGKIYARIFIEVKK